ncbi:alpha-keto acid decarboxylase family protein [Pseudonocardia sp. KRD291]|uniref:alpha-keto acid decarboxylase family protein n=1 Tax=Pseudonocardia sp. KRD291 TaxID=2792007 RepID=UPI001C4A4736|nr:thiamine pyrophosphate-binding protein [Pseudonocardia sp. KRD291]MBW0105415.1 alpha-keto acid decarboxylase family protein [Pseudonocardia sp. KRD291]
MQTVTVAQYLARRLGELGVEHLFGVPGDFSLTLLDHMLAEGRQQWVGSPNELNAGYAADGYARTRGMAALVTTYGVGELSAIDAVAGAYAENVPLVQITGAPPSALAEAGALLHHTLGDGDFGRFARAYAEVTTAGAVLTAGDAPARIDEVLATAVRELRPVYLAVPVDVATALVPAPAAPLPRATADARAVAEFRRRAANLLAPAHSAVLVAGHLVERTGAVAPFGRLVDAAASPVVTLTSGRGALDPASPHFAGVYCGTIGAKRAILAVDTADVMIEAGTLMADAVTGMFSHRDDPAHTIHLGVHTATVAGRVIDGVPFASALEVLTELVDGDVLRRDVPDAAPEGPEAGTALDQATLWAHLQRWFPRGHRLVTDIGTSSWGAAGITLPAGTDVVAQPVWSSIGYALPASLGCAVADPSRRPVLVIGDGAAQMTVQELSSLARLPHPPIVVVVDNSGYTIERALQSPQAVYNDVAEWDWCALARAFAPGVDLFTAAPATPGELDAALDRAAASPDRLAVLHVRTHPLDLPAGLRGLADRYQGR